MPLASTSARAPFSSEITVVLQNIGHMDNGRAAHDPKPCHAIRRRRRITPLLFGVAAFAMHRYKAEELAVVNS
jgi:hypothetical protein